MRVRIDLAVDRRDTRDIDAAKITSMHIEVAHGAYDVLADGTYGPKTEPDAAPATRPDRR